MASCRTSRWTTRWRTRRSAPTSLPTWRPCADTGHHLGPGFGHSGLPALACPQHRIGVLRPATAAVVAAQGQEQVALFDVQVVAQDHAAEAQVALHVEQA